MSRVCSTGHKQAVFVSVKLKLTREWARMTSSYLNMWNFLLSPERVFNEGIIYGRASRVKGTNRELWSTRNRKWQKTSPPQVLKGHKEETALVFWCLIQVHVSEKKLSLQTSSPGERRSCQSLICSKLAVENEMPSSSTPPAHQLPLSSLWSAVSASYWLNPVGN